MFIPTFFECAWPWMAKVPKIASLHYLLQDLKKDERDKVNFLPADKHQSFLQVNTLIFDGYARACPKLPK